MQFDQQFVKAKATAIRKHIIKMIGAAGSGHPGGSLSAADIVATLFFGDVLRFRADEPEWAERDFFILSKGHAAPVLYATLAESGFIEKDELLTLRQLGSRLQGHPDSRKLPGIEVSTGSLGQGLSIASGIALGLAVQSAASDDVRRVYVLLGDGELQEGQVWEAAMFAAHRRLTNLIAIVDNNGLQIDGSLDEVLSLGDIADKFRAFGWQTIVVDDGHHPQKLKDAFEQAKLAVKNQDGAPVAIIAKTIKGKGVSFMESLCGWHGKAPDEAQCEQALLELEANCV